MGVQHVIVGAGTVGGHITQAVDPKTLLGVIDPQPDLRFLNALGVHQDSVINGSHKVLPPLLKSCSDDRVIVHWATRDPDPKALPETLGYLEDRDCTFVLISSLAVYSPMATAAVESAALGPSTDYGIKKLAEEQQLAEAPNVSKIVIRCTGLVGCAPTGRRVSRSSNPILQVAAALELGNSACRVEMEDQKDQYLSTRFLADAVVGLAESGQNGVYNVGPGEYRHPSHYLDLLGAASGLSIIPALTAPTGPLNPVLNASKLKRSLRELKVPTLRDTIADALRCQLLIGSTAL